MGVVSPWNDMSGRMYDMQQEIREMDRKFDTMQRTMRQSSLLDSPRDSFHDVDATFRDSLRNSGLRDSFHDTIAGSSFRDSFRDSLLESSIVRDRDGRRLASFKFDLRDFRPEEITIKSFDNEHKLEISAVHDEKDDRHEVHKEYKRSAVIPDGVDMKTVRSKLMPDGVLCIEAPLPDPDAIPIQIQHETL
jgi:hypothetical protein